MYSIFELFRIGLGPSSSHTVGPMVAANYFINSISNKTDIVEIKIELFGSLALTGKGHGTDKAVVLGLSGKLPALLDPDDAENFFMAMEKSQTLLDGTPFALKFNTKVFLPEHPNGMTFKASFQDDTINEQTWFSIGGGAVTQKGDEQGVQTIATPLPYPFSSGDQLLIQCEKYNFTMAQIALQSEPNKLALRE